MKIMKKIFNKELQIELFSTLLDHYSTERLLSVYSPVIKLLEEEDRLNQMTPTQRAIHDANLDPEDGPQCRLDKFVLGECGANEDSIYYESARL